MSKPAVFLRVLTAGMILDGAGVLEAVVDSVVDKKMAKICEISVVVAFSSF